MSSQLPTRSIGALEVTVVGIGCNNFGSRLGALDAADTRQVVDAALENGINLFDTSDSYGGEGASERLLGEALRGRREQAVIATKFGSDMSDVPGYPDAPRGSREWIRHAVRQSLQRLGVETIDLYQYHRPDGVTPVEETRDALDELVTEGLVREIGASNFDAELIDRSAAHSKATGCAAWVSIQNEYSLLDREIEREVTPACERHGLGILPFFPLASGLLTGKYRRGEDAPAGTRLHALSQLGDRYAGDDEGHLYDQLEALAAYAERRGVSPVDVAVGALIAQPAVTSVIAGATKSSQVVANARAAAWQPSAADLAELDGIFPAAGPAARAG